MLRTHQVAPFLGVLFVWIFNSFPLKAQKKLYDVFFMGSKVGSMTIERKAEGNVEYYHLRSWSEAGFLAMKRSNSVEMRSTYKNGKLLSSFARVITNGEVESYASAVWDGQRYQVQTDKEKFSVDEQADFSVVKFYFEEPQTPRIFAERIGRFVPLYSPRQGVYQYRLPSGDLNIYTYLNGELQDVTVKRSLGTAQIKQAMN